MSDAHSEAARRLYEEVMPGGDADAGQELVSEDFLNHASPPGTPRGPEGIRRQIAMLDAAFTDQSYDIQHLVADGDCVAVHCTWRATHTGEFMGIPATNKAIESRQAHILRFDDDGRIAEHWAVRDDLTMLRQMGIAPG